MGLSEHRDQKATASGSDLSAEESRTLRDLVVVQAPRSTSSDLDSGGLFLGRSRASQRLFSEVLNYAKTPYSVLLVGPTGVGKTAIAELIHQWSDRRAGPFVPCPLPAIPEELRHAELSGTARGAFTGATSDRAGLVEAASGGTLFLDELGHASLQLQQALLTILESRFVQRVGEARRRKVDTRFIMASSSDLVDLCQRGRFLEELLYRVEGFTIRVPTLRERREDIVPMAERFVREALHELGRSDDIRMTMELREYLSSLTWPGNVRQLRMTCRRLAVNARYDAPLDVDDLLRSSDERSPSAGSPRERALQAMTAAGGNKSKAAKALNITRARLYRLLAED